MRVVVQRTYDASVSIGGVEVARIEKGLVLLVGVTHDDTREDAEYIARKIAAMRIFEDADGKMNLSIRDVEGDILSISQFTLYADCRKGNRPSFVQAARPEQAEPLYDYFNHYLRSECGMRVHTGRFGADMKVRLVNDGPVTILIDSQHR